MTAIQFRHSGGIQVFLRIPGRWLESSPSITLHWC